MRLRKIRFRDLDDAAVTAIPEVTGLVDSINRVSVETVRMILYYGRIDYSI